METNDPRLTSTSVQLSPSGTPGYTHAKALTEESAKRTSSLLTLNHSLYHTVWKASFHNHIVHHLLALWALGASPDEIQHMWDFNQPYQAPIERYHEDGSANLKFKDLEDPTVFDQCLGNGDYYADFLRFFEGKIAEQGMQGVIKEYVLKGDERANDIFCRMYTDLVHPMIHLGCAIEFQQPSLAAEALAGACVHDNWPKVFLLPTEEGVQLKTSVPSRSLLEILESLRGDPDIVSGVKSSDPFNKIPDGFLKRVSGRQLVPYLSQFRVEPTPDDLQRKMAEMMFTGAYIMGAAQRPGKREAIDFVLLHSVTLSVFYPAIMAQIWLSNHDKARLIEAKARVDAVMYAGCGCPALFPERITGYVPQHVEDGWPELFQRSIVYRDEGHAAKLIRALFSVEELTEGVPNFPIAKKDIIKIAHMAMDSIENVFETKDHKMTKDVADSVIQRIGHGGEMVVDNMIRWVFYGGLETSWDYVPDLEITVAEPHKANKP
ncbi:hypothetical protein F4805DRAFT_431801 [Annulohypoxylon moriforme]|nr:hypothetical protein F4805DRAFT_431801 [Annulohypoxylon moriforme]